MNPIQQITSKDNPKLKNAAQLVQSKKHRRQQGEFIAEGYRLCMDALRSGKRPLRTFVTQQLLDKEDCSQLLEQSQETFLISQELSAKLSDTQTPQGVFCVFPIPAPSKLDQFSHHRIVILSSLQDPGNIGTIIRTSEALGADMILMSSDCPELYSPKILRATMGGVFRMPVCVTEDLTGDIALLRQEGVKVYAAALKEQSVPITQLDFLGNSAIVIGNEGKGLTDEVIEACTSPMLIPMEGKAESLNAAAAAAISIWEMCRRG